MPAPDNRYYPLGTLPSPRAYHPSACSRRVQARAADVKPLGLRICILFAIEPVGAALPIAVLKGAASCGTPTAELPSRPRVMRRHGPVSEQTGRVFPDRPCCRHGPIFGESANAGTQSQRPPVAVPGRPGPGRPGSSKFAAARTWWWSPAPHRFGIVTKAGQFRHVPQKSRVEFHRAQPGLDQGDCEYGWPDPRRHHSLHGALGPPEGWRRGPVLPGRPLRRRLRLVVPGCLSQCAFASR